MLPIARQPERVPRMFSSWRPVVGQDSAGFRPQVWPRAPQLASSGARLTTDTVGLESVLLTSPLCTHMGPLGLKEGRGVAPLGPNAVFLWPSKPEAGWRQLLAPVVADGKMPGTSFPRTTDRLSPGQRPLQTSVVRHSLCPET